MTNHPVRIGSRKINYGRSGLGSVVLFVAASVLPSSCAKALDDADSEKGSSSACKTVQCGAACGTTKPCAAGTYCGTDSKCTADCTQNSECPSGNTCQTDVGQCSIFSAEGGGGGGVIPGSTGGTEGTLAPSLGGVKEVDPSVPQQLAANACSGWATELETVPAVLEFVIDTSYSMAEMKAQGTTWTLNGQGQTKWKITHDALVSALDGLSADVATGMVFFPNHAIVNQRFTQEQDPSACFNPANGIPIELMGAAGSAHRSALSSGLNAIQPNGNTPTYEAYYYAVTQMLAANQFDGQKYMVLLTDGVPTFGKGCTGSGTEQPDNIIPTDPIIGLIRDAATVGINTFVIGAPGSQDGVSGADARPWLSAAAREGMTAPSDCNDTGTPRFCHMDMTQAADFGAELRSGLGVIASQLGNCQYGMPEPPPGESIDVNQLNVFISNNSGTYLIMPSTEGTCTEGWRIVNNTIELCPDSCNRAQLDPGASVQILAGCTTDQVIESIPLL